MKCLQISRNKISPQKETAQLPLSRLSGNDSSPCAGMETKKKKKLLFPLPGRGLETLCERRDKQKVLLKPS